MIDQARRSSTMMAGMVVVALACSSATGTDRVAGSTIAALAVDPPSSTLVVGAELPLRALAQDESGRIVPDAAIVWSVKDSTIARVSATGILTARAVGSTQVAASAGGVSALATVLVRPAPVASVVVQPATLTLLQGTTAHLTATTRDANGAPLTERAVAWTSSNGAVAAVSPSGDVTAGAAGSATITATSEGVSGSAVVTVTQPPVATVALQPAALTIAPGQTAPLTATTRGADGTVLTGRSITYTSDNTGVATVSTSGVVTGVAAGVATITATSEGQRATAAVTVRVPVAFVVVAPNFLFIGKNTTVTLSATAYDARFNRLTGRTFTWVSSDPAIATVDSTGLVKTLKAGFVTITVTVEGQSDSSLINVTN